MYVCLGVRLFGCTFVWVANTGEQMFALHFLGETLHVKFFVKFDYHNLKHDSGMRNLDVVFCRNVLIYFDDVAQQAVIDRFWNAMAPKSYLYIGHSESLFGMKTQFEFLKTDWACLYQKNI